jgi:hypothetical protein
LEVDRVWLGLGDLHTALQFRAIQDATSAKLRKYVDKVFVLRNTRRWHHRRKAAVSRSFAASTCFKLNEFSVLIVGEVDRESEVDHARQPQAAA